MANLKSDYFGKGENTEDPDCFPRALANVGGIDFEEAMMISLRFGWNNGMKFKDIARLCKHYDFKIFATDWEDGEPFIQQFGEPVFPSMTVKQAVAHLKKTQGRYIIGLQTVDITGHVFSMVGGKVFDNGQSGNDDEVLCIIACEKIESELEPEYDDDYE